MKLSAEQRRERARLLRYTRHIANEALDAAEQAQRRHRPSDADVFRAVAATALQRLATLRGWPLPQGDPPA
jgi:hypothetical protein